MDGCAPAACSLATPEATATGRRHAPLVEAARNGDARAWSALVRAHLPAMVRLAARLAGAEHAEDVVQESLITAARIFGRYRPDASLRAFLLGVTARHAARWSRGMRRRKAREEVAALEPAPVARPDETAEAARLAAAVRAALATLPERRRRAVVLRLDGGLSHAEIAQAMGISEATARVHVHKGLAELRARLAPWMGTMRGVTR